MQNSSYGALEFGVAEQQVEGLGKRLLGLAVTTLSRVFGKSAENLSTPRIEYRMPRPADFTTDLLEETEAGGGYRASRSQIKGLILPATQYKEVPTPIIYNSIGLPELK